MKLSTDQPAFTRHYVQPRVVRSLARRAGRRFRSRRRFLRSYTVHLDPRHGKGQEVVLVFITSVLSNQAGMVVLLADSPIGDHFALVVSGKNIAFAFRSQHEISLTTAVELAHEATLEELRGS